MNELDGVSIQEDGCSDRASSMGGAAFPSAVPSKPFCIRGHAYTPENTIWQQGKYRCKTCKLQNAKIYRRRVKHSAFINRGKGYRQDARSTTPVIRQLFALMIEQGVTLKEISVKAGYYERQLSAWKHGRQRPNINAVVDLYNALGYDLVPVKRAKQ